MTTTNPAETNGTVQTKPAPVAAIVPHTDNDDSSRALNAFGSAANFSHAQRMAKLLSFSTMVPKAYQGDEGIANCIIALELAARIGASVFMVMQNLDIIHGRPGWRATFLIATVNASGRFTPLRFRFEGMRGKDDWGCRAFAKDRESGEECVGALIDMGMVKAEGWLQKSGSKWLTMPEQMFLYRAAGFWTRVYAPELSLGMQTAEEVIDTTGYETPVASMVAVTSAKSLEASILAAPAPAAPAAAPAKPATVEPKAPAPTETKPAAAPIAPELFGPDPKKAAPPEEHPLVTELRGAIAACFTQSDLARVVRGIGDATKAKRLTGEQSMRLYAAATEREKAIKGTGGEPPPGALADDREPGVD